MPISQESDNIHPPMESHITGQRKPLIRSPKLRALFALILIVPAPTIGALMALWWYEGETIGKVAYSLGKMWLYGLPIVWLLFVERDRLSLSPPTRGGFGFGIVSGIVISIAIWLVWVFYARDAIDPTAIRTVTAENNLNVAWKYIGFGCYLFLINAALEEYVFRWFIFRQCERLLPAALAIVLAAIIFTLHHVIVLRAYFEWTIVTLASLGIFIGGAIWSWTYLKYRSIWPGYISHAIVDIAILIIGWQLIFSK